MRKTREPKDAVFTFRMPQRDHYALASYSEHRSAVAKRESVSDRHNKIEEAEIAWRKIGEPYLVRVHRGSHLDVRQFGFERTLVDITNTYGKHRVSVEDALTGKQLKEALSFIDTQKKEAIQRLEDAYKDMRKATGTEDADEINEAYLSANDDALYAMKDILAVPVRTESELKFKASAMKEACAEFMNGCEFGEDDGDTLVRSFLAIV